MKLRYKLLAIALVLIGLWVLILHPKAMAAELSLDSENELMSEALTEQSTDEAESESVTELATEEVTEAVLDSGAVAMENEETAAAESLMAEGEETVVETEPAPKEPISVKLGRWLKMLFPDSREAWMEWIRTWIMPNLLRGLISGIVLCMIQIPSMRRINRGSSRFQQATDGVVETKAQVAQCKQQLAEAEERLAETTEQMRRQLEAYGELMADVRRILCLGFGNNDDLVKKGISAKIMKMDKDRKEEEEHEENA